jgi:VWFA-related protein
LQANQFRVMDNGKEQAIHVETSYVPISMVIAVQANAGVESILPQVRRIPELLNQLIIGDMGKAAVLAFDHRLQLLQSFTSNPDLIETAIRRIHAGSSTSRLTDGIGESVRLLGYEPKNRRRVVLLISETRDLGSASNKREVLLSAEINNVEVYAVAMSRFVDAISGKSRKVPRPDPLLTTQKQGRMPAFIPAEPTSVEATFGLNGQRAEFIPLFKEVLRDIHDVFVDNPVELMTKGTGGEEYSFIRQRGLEDALEDLSSALNNQYMVTYTPNNREEAGFHDIEVTVIGVLAGARVRARPGYWVSAKY